MDYFSNITNNDNSMSFILNNGQQTNIDKSLPNAIRRLALSEFPTYSFNSDPYSDCDITISDNTTSLNNEFMAHRIGLIPINIVPIEYFNEDNIQFEINCKNVDKDMKTITSKDIKIRYINTGKLLEEDKRDLVFPPNKISGDYILIGILKPNIYDPEKGEEFKCIAKCSRGIGKQHSRYSPVSKIVMYNTKDPNKVNKLKKETIAKKTEELERPLTDEELVKVNKQIDIFDADRCYYTDDNNEPNVFHIDLETIGVYSNQYIISHSLHILKEKMELFKSYIEKGSIEFVEFIHPETLNSNYIDTIIKYDTHTLGNILQSYLFKNHLNKEIKFVGYKVPHPLETKCIIRIELNTEDKIDKKIELVKSLMINTIDYINSIAISLKNEWDNHHNITPNKDIKSHTTSKVENKTIQAEIGITTNEVNLGKEVEVDKEVVEVVEVVEEVPKKRKKLKIVQK